jgi:hypothetical protein
MELYGLWVSNAAAFRFFFSTRDENFSLFVWLMAGVGLF